MTPKTLIAAIAVIFLALSALASAETIQANPAELTLTAGGTAEVSYVLDSAPSGIAGYMMVLELTNPGVADITAVQFPSWGSLNNVTTLPADTVQLSAVDLELIVGPGATQVPLASITIRGQNTGVTEVRITSIQLTADGGENIQPSLPSLRVTTVGSSTGTGGSGGGGGSVSTSTTQQTSQVTRTVTTVTTAPVAVSTTAAAAGTSATPNALTMAPDTPATTASSSSVPESDGGSLLFTVAIIGIIVLVILIAAAVIALRREERMP
ncbi:cell surface protein [hydrocarbon metagenome]|uniref:Cell surface protein n=1 Tax=hydrocarbon metagenome TaxID=938273 RepID=A0A0W8ENB5_9ZZZZ